jgi:hypothetical protein
MFDLKTFLITEDLRTIAEATAEATADPAGDTGQETEQLTLIDACTYRGPRNRGRNVKNVAAIDPLGNVVA